MTKFLKGFPAHRSRACHWALRIQRNNTFYWGDWLIILETPLSCCSARSMLIWSKYMIYAGLCNRGEFKVAALKVETWVSSCTSQSILRETVMPASKVVPAQKPPVWKLWRSRQGCFRVKVRKYCSEGKKISNKKITSRWKKRWPLCSLSLFLPLLLSPPLSPSPSHGSCLSLLQGLFVAVSVSPASAEEKQL